MKCNLIKTFLITLVLVLTTYNALAQQKYPARPYRQDELVSFKPDVPMNMVLSILSSFTQRFDTRIIIDPLAHTHPIGVSVENMYWKRALEYILRSNMLQYSVRDRYYEIEKLIETDQSHPISDEELITIDRPEIEINAVFFQADYETLFELGINWSTLKNGTVQIFANGANQVVQNFLDVTIAGTVNGVVQVNALLRAFESQNKGEIIARPQIRVMSGEQGKIKVGKNFFLALQDFAGNTRFTEYEAGVILTVTPTLIGRNDSTFIYLDLIAERSDVQSADIGVTKNITEGRTQVLLLDGEETVIAGLVSYEKNKLRKGIPILRDLPSWLLGLRYMFGYESQSVKKQELVILVQAKIVPSLLKRSRIKMSARGYLKKQKRELNKSIGYERVNKNKTMQRPKRRNR